LSKGIMGHKSDGEAEVILSSTGDRTCITSIKMFKIFALVLLTFVFLEVESAPNFKTRDEADLRVERQISDCYDMKPRECFQLTTSDCGKFAVQRSCARTCQMCDYLIA